MEYRYITYVACCGEALRYVTGWLETIEKAKAEAEQMLAEALPAGVYQVSMNLIKRPIEL